MQGNVKMNIKKNILFVLFFVVLFCSAADCADVTLKWNPVEKATGYKIYFGAESRDYEPAIDADNNTTYTIKDMPDGVFYFAVTAYNNVQESEYSVEKGPIFIDTEEPLDIPSGFSGTVIYKYAHGHVVEVVIEE